MYQVWRQKGSSLQHIHLGVSSSRTFESRPFYAHVPKLCCPRGCTNLKTEKEKCFHQEPCLLYKLIICCVTYLLLKRCSLNIFCPYLKVTVVLVHSRMWQSDEKNSCPLQILHFTVPKKPLHFYDRLVVFL